MVKPPATVEILEAGMRATNLRQKVIAQNIANLDTPGYRRKTVEFESLLSKAIQSGDSSEAAKVEPTVTEDPDADPDGGDNGVDLDVEIGDMIKSGGAYKTYVRMLARLYRQMDMAMQGE
jgi:flagellar basal-body rod protein FlgB